MAFNQPQSGWTAMSLAPNPDLFAAATNNINRVSSGITSPVTSPVTSPLPLAPAPAYAQLQQSMFPQLQAQQLQAQQLAAQAQATAAPAGAYAAVEKQLKTQPWTTPTTSTMPQSKFLDPAGAKAPASGWVPGVPQI